MVTPVFVPQTKNPNYPFQPSSGPAALDDYLSARNVLHAGERIKSVAPASARSRNTVLRVTTNKRSVVLKVFQEWPQNGGHAPPAAERLRAECLFHDSVRVADRLGVLLPDQLHSDARAGCVLLEDAGARRTRSPALGRADVRSLAWFLVSLHHHSQSLPARARHRSDELVHWQAERLFDRFFHRRRGDARSAAEKKLWSSPVARRGFADAKECLLVGGASLVHGDFLPWNWAGEPGSLKVIDAECSFFGCPEFDAGSFLAGLLLSRQDHAAIAEAVVVLSRGCMRYEPGLVAAFAAAHVCSILARDPLDRGLVCGTEAVAIIERALAAMWQRDLRRFLPGASLRG